MNVLYAITVIVVIFRLGSIAASLKRLTDHNVKFPAPGTHAIEEGMVVYMEPFQKVVSITGISERPTGMLQVAIEPFEAPEQTFAPEAL